MSTMDSVLSFVEGVKSVIDVSGAIRSSVSNAISNGISGAFESGAIQASVSDAVSDGIGRAFMRIRKPLEGSILKVTFIAGSLFFMVWGMAQFLDYFMPYRGLGFVVAGAAFGIIALVFIQEKEIGETGMLKLNGW